MFICTIFVEVFNTFDSFDEIKMGLCTHYVFVVVVSIIVRVFVSYVCRFEHIISNLLGTIRPKDGPNRYTRNFFFKFIYLCSIML